jgi:hypothetical protein
MRAAKKNALLIEQKMKLASAILEIEAQPNIWLGLAHMTKAISIVAMIGHISRTPSKVMRLDGKVDKRRYRRYVTKHRRVYIIKQNQGRIDVQEKNKIMQKTQEALPITGSMS